MRVTVPDVPVALYFANFEQLDEAVRWLWLVLGDDDQRLPLTRDDAARTEEILHRFEPHRRVASVQAAAAQAAGSPTFTVEIDFPPGAREDLEGLLNLLDLVDRLLLEQHLAMPASDEIRIFRRRLIGDMVRQLQAAPAD